MTEQLKALAIKTKRTYEGVDTSWFEEGAMLLEFDIHPDDAAFIAAASPEVVLALIENHDACKSANSMLIEEVVKLEAERDALAKEAEALRQINAAYRNMETTIVISPYQQEFDKLKAKLAALESQEPVAWVWKYEYSNGGYIDYLCKSEIEAHGYTESLLMDGTVIPLFTAAGAKESK